MTEPRDHALNASALALLILAVVIAAVTCGCPGDVEPHRIFDVGDYEPDHCAEYRATCVPMPGNPCDSCPTED